MKFLGIDYGERKVGLALSDEDGRVAFPHKVLSRKAALEYIGTLREQEGVEEVVVGEPCESNGGESSLAEAVGQFARELHDKLNLSVNLEREWWSTFEAARLNKDMGKGRRDASAAAIILQRYLDKNNFQQTMHNSQHAAW